MQDNFSSMAIMICYNEYANAICGVFTLVCKIREYIIYPTHCDLPGLEDNLLMVTVSINDFEGQELTCIDDFCYCGVGEMKAQ